MSHEPFVGAHDAVACAPGRVNLLGEHTDYNEGLVLPTAIPQQTRVAARVLADGPFSVYSADLDESAEFSLDEVPQAHFAQYVYGCLKQIANRGVAIPALQIHIDSDVPIGVGLSSSAALEVAVLRALRKLLNLDLDDVEIAKIAQAAEIQYAGVNCGILDQMASSLLSPGAMLYLDTRTLKRELLPLPPDSEILVIDSGVARSLATSKYNERRGECEKAARQLSAHSLRDVSIASVETLPEPLRRRARHVVTENARVEEARQQVSAERFGELMNASHKSLRDDYEVSIPALDELVSVMQQQDDVYGAKLTGAGFGGACVGLCRTGSAMNAGRDILLNYSASGRKGRLLVPFAS